MKKKIFYTNAIADGFIRCVCVCFLADYMGSIYCGSFTSTKQYYLTSIVLACAVFIVHIILAPKVRSVYRSIEFSLFSILWCNGFKVFAVLLRLFVPFHIFPPKENFYGEAFDQIIVLGISHLLFAGFVLLMWLFVLIRGRIGRFRDTMFNNKYSID